MSRSLPLPERNVSVDDTVVILNRDGSIVDMPSYAPLSNAIDPVGKLRVSAATSLIDTDFEYSTQPTKWEQISLTNNRPTAFYDPTAPIPFTAITGAGTRIVTVATSSPPPVGTMVLIQDALDPNASGWFYVDTVSAGVSFTYIADLVVASGAQFDPTRTYIFTGTNYSQSGIPLSASAGAAFTNSGTTVTCTTTGAHGLYPNNPIYVFGCTATTNPPNGAWLVLDTPTANTFRFVVLNAPTGTITASAGAIATLFARPNGVIYHRAFDGGVGFSAGSASPGAQTIRQTRRYFRYQSGKGLQLSTGTSLRPSLAVSQLTASGTTVTVTTNQPHQLTQATVVLVENASPGYNGTFAITSVPNEKAFTYTATTAPTITPSRGFPIRVSPFSWWGSANRVGPFDQQNGFYFEFNGQTLSAVRRSSTNQIAGTVAVTNGSQVINGTNTQFADQLDLGDYIVIRGMSHRVMQINSQTSMIINPEYKGQTLSTGVIVSKTVNTRIPQKDWHDPCNGTGPSGYVLNLSRIQMFYIDYSWYAAGVARFGFRTVDGTINYVHAFVHNNDQFEAYMRSGNLPAHYESNAEIPITRLTATLASAATTGAVISAANTELFPPAGTLRLTNPGATGTVEAITYTAKTDTGFVIGARAQAGGNAAAQTFTFSATAHTAIELITPSSAAAISHWGSSMIMDGGFDDDKSLIFNTGMTSPMNIASGQERPVISIRLAPSVDSGFTGVLGAREIINRMQLKLDSLGLLTTGTFLIQARLNGRVTGGTFTNAGGSSLAQTAIHNGTQTMVAGTGENAAAYYTDATTGATTRTTLDLKNVRDLGNSILGGGTNNNVPTTAANLYPDGPDVITIVATNLGGSSATILARLGWTEAQA
jgi:hypothetical protein